jgi:hypothetical protein
MTLTVTDLIAIIVATAVLSGTVGALVVTVIDTRSIEREIKDKSNV